MKKKILVVLMAIICCFGAVTVSGCGETESESVATVWTASSSEVFVQDVIPETFPEAKLNLSAMKGETESGQIMITANKYIRGINVETADLTDEKGSVIAKENVKIYGEHYVEILSPYINSGNTNVTIAAPAGFYPDALIPYANFQAKREDRVEAGNNQGIWVDVKVPENAKAGNYTSVIKLTLGEEKETVTVPITLKVYDMQMPVEVHSRSAFNIWYSQIASGEKENYTAETNQKYFDYLLEKRLCSSSVDPNKRTNLSQYIDYMVELAMNPKVTTYQVQNVFLGIKNPNFLAERPPQSVGKSEEEIAKLKTEAENTAYAGIKNVFTKILEKNVSKIEEDGEKYGKLNMFKKLVFYFQDEPTRGYRTQMIKKFNQIMTQVKRDVISENQATFNKYPFLAESLKNDVRDMTPTDIIDSDLFVSDKPDGTPDYEKGDGTTLFVLHCYKFNSESARAIIKKRQSYGEQYWWYTCVRNSPALSYYVESKTMNMRLQGWQQFEYSLLGVLYWDVVQWGYFPDYNPYKTLEMGNGWGNGEGVLLYPGQPYGVNGPVSSIRMENIFQAQEDYEYLYMLNEYVEEYNKANGTTFNVHDIVGNMIKDLHEGTFIKESATPAQLESCRIRVLNILEKFTKGDADSAIADLQKEAA